MTFKEIKQGMSVYILDKKDLTVAEGKVTAVQPHVGNLFSGGAMQTGAQPMQDVTIEVGGKATAYTIPEQLSVTFAGDTVIATEKNGLADEVERMKKKSEDVIASVNYHKKVIEMVPKLMSELKPELREKQETERRLTSMENGLKEIGSLVRSLVDKLG